MSEPEEKITVLKNEVLNHSVRQLWDAWINSERVIVNGPQGSVSKFEKLNLTKGGHWIFSRKDGNGFQSSKSGVITELVPFKKIVSTLEYSNGNKEMRIIIDFEEKEKQCGFKFSVAHPLEDVCNYSNLAEFVGLQKAIFRMIQ